VRCQCRPTREGRSALHLHARLADGHGGGTRRNFSLRNYSSNAKLRCRVARFHPSLQEKNTMLNYAVIFLVVALVAAVFGFGGIAAGAVEIAKILFFIFAFMAIVTFVVSLIRKG
jgi:uncharacterized membrane protein YtjA (UPF0391 family)